MIGLLVATASSPAPSPGIRHGCGLLPTMRTGVSTVSLGAEVGQPGRIVFQWLPPTSLGVLARSAGTPALVPEAWRAASAWSVRTAR